MTEESMMRPAVAADTGTPLSGQRKPSGTPLNSYPIPAPTAVQRWMVMGMEPENKGLIDVRDCPCDGCQAKPCGHPARCVKFTLWLNKTVEAVEVVRCKDCKHYANYGRVCDCKKYEGMNLPNEDDFCSYGERKDNEG